jgi:CheY-like chemotaxis protein
MTTSQSRTIATLMSDAAIVRMTSNCSNLINACTTFRHSCDQRGLHLRNKCAWQVLGLEGRAMVQPTDDHDQLRGVRVLVVEDDSLLAMDLEATLVHAGAVVVDLCQTLDEAMLRADAGDFAVAVLDFGLGSETVSPVARQLVNRGVPFVLYTGKSRHEPSLAEWRHCSILQKPASTRALVSAVRAALSR